LYPHTRIVTYCSIKPVVQTALSEKKNVLALFFLFFDTKAHKEVDGFVHLQNVESVDILLLPVVVPVVFTVRTEGLPVVVSVVFTVRTEGLPQ